MSKELFICGDPRWLSGGASRCSEINYDRAPSVVSPPDAVDTEKVMSVAVKSRLDVPGALAAIGQRVHRGKASYHHRPLLNSFLELGMWPSAGVELETEEREGISLSELEKDLVSNWFHFESDSSLCKANRSGYELITEPLPPRVYRDPRTWAGLQNLLNPWLESFGHKETGLHVHVGLNQFEECGDLPLPGKCDRKTLGKYASAFVYYCLLDRSFVDHVMLRRNTGYCQQTSSCELADLQAEADSGRMTAGDLFDALVEKFIRCSRGNWENAAYNAACQSGSRQTEWLATPLSGFDGHGTEVNCAHPYTVEFRRGKGTLHSLSVHRIVEFTTMVVRYAWKLARNPGMVVSQEGAYDFIIENTTNPALRQLAEKAKGGKACA